MSKKRGVVEVQFNWIFILIIGGIILLFFLGVVRTQKKVAETKISATISTDLRAILSGVEVSTQTASLIGIPKAEIEYECQGYTVGGITGMRPIASFSPNLIKSNKLFSWALPWSIPYRAMNFIYLTSPEVRYIIVDDEPSNPDSPAKLLNALLPQRFIAEEGKERLLMNKEIVPNGAIPSVADITDLNNYKVRFIFFSDPSSISLPPDLQNSKHDITAIWIDPESSLPSEKKLEGYGTITYYYSDGTDFQEVSASVSPSPTTYYLGLPSLLAAVFAEDIESYNCNMERAFKKLGFITAIYFDKTSEMYDHFNLLGSVCADTYDNAKTSLTAIEEDSITLSKGLRQTEIEEIYNTAFSDLNPNSIFELNDQAQKLSCPEIY
tara:strand:- start:18264 stop:19406 length:1143 start_codon:yes stop_codon:yes gene_type:complete